MKNINIFIILIIISLIATSCEDTIEVDSGFDTPQLVVDAWIDNLSRNQTITITRSQDYFDSSLFVGVTDAIVTVSNDQQIFSFNHMGDGNYVLTISDGGRIGEVGDEFTLEIEADGKRYSSTTTMRRVPVIDSISVFFEEESGFSDEGLFAQAYARDFAGTGDAYWMRSWKNDTLANRPSEVNLIWDATFDPGSGLDGVAFITPIRGLIVPTDDDGSSIPYLPGDEIYVELMSISQQAFAFMSLAIEQATNGDNGIFALPLANARGNIIEIDSDNRALGMFNVGAVSIASKTVE